jgi:UDP-apiose/xylose synthase
LNLGAGGFIGAHLTKRLLDEGHRVVAVDVCGDKIADLRDQELLTFLEADIRASGFDLRALVRDADLVVDLVAYANPALYVQMPLEVFHLNFTENLKIAEACVEFGKRLVQFSSSEVYGKSPAAFLADKLVDPEDPALATFSEDTTEFILGPVAKHRWIYASAKQLLERVLHAYGLEDRLNYTIIRPFNFIGPKIDFLPSEAEGMPRVFSFFMDALLNGKPMKLVDGGGQRRSYTYIDDAIECIYRIVLNPGGVCDRQIFNVGSVSNEVSIRQLAELMRTVYSEVSGMPSSSLPETVSVPAETFYGAGYEDSDRRIPDMTKARTLLDWEASYGMREALERTMAYYMDRQGACANAVSP